MSGERHVDGIVDRALRDLDEEIRRVLDVEPSEGFVRGVYARIEQQQRASFASSRWWAACAVAAAIVVAVAFGVTRSGEVSGPAPAPKHRAPDISLASQEQPPVRTAPARRTSVKKGPDVIVSPGRRRAMERFIGLARSGALDPSVLMPASGAPPAELVIAPLTVAPIAIPDVEVATITPRGEGSPQSR